MVWNKHVPAQVDPGKNSEEQLHTEELIAELKSGEFHACEELYELYKRGNQQAYDALLLEARRESAVLIQLILQKIKEKDDASIDILIDSKGKLVLFWCKRYFSDQQQAEDMAQEALLKAVRSLKKGEYEFQGAGTFTSWLSTITSNICATEIKKMKAQKRGGNITIVSIDEQTDQLPSPKPSPEDIMMYGERKARMKMLVNQLSEDLRDTIILIDYERLSYMEAARILRASEGAIKSRRHRAIKKLEEMIESMDSEDREILFVNGKHSEEGGARNG